MATEHSTTRNVTTRVGLGLLRAVCALPRPAGLWVGRLIGRIAWQSASIRRYVCLRNLELAFPDMPLAERRKLAKQVFLDQGCSLIEMGWAWWQDNASVKLTIHGREALDTALDSGQGLALIGAHYSSLEMVGPLLARVIPNLASTYRPHNSAVLQDALAHGRSNSVQLIDRANVRGSLKHLSGGGALIMFPDQDLGAAKSVFAPFFACPAATTPALRKMIEGRATSVFFRLHRLSANHYELEFSDAPLRLDDDQSFAEDLNHALCALIAKKPAQYLWVHRRYKSRPPGEAKVYAQ